MDRFIRVAICQLQCHPALLIDGQGYVNEPFAPGSAGSLSMLSTKGLDVSSALEECGRTYLRWATRRLDAVLAFLTPLEPDVVIFPEGGITIEMLLSVQRWSRDRGATILAGTHTPRHTPSALQVYRGLGIEDSQIEKLKKYRARNVLPIFTSGKARLIPKRLISIFEKSIIGAEDGDPALPFLHPFEIALQHGPLSVLPMVCSDALQTHNVSQPYELVLISSCDARPAQFESMIKVETSNKRFVVYCNDGHAGGSRVGFVMDQRVSNWLNTSFPAGLPAEDAVLVADLNLEVTSVQQGTAVPAYPFELVRLARVVGDQGAEGERSRTLDRLRDTADDDQRLAGVQDLERHPTGSKIDAARSRKLLEAEKSGDASARDWWSTIGGDLLVSDQGDLKQLEGELASKCASQIEPVLSENGQADEISLAATRFFLECKRMSRQTTTVPSVSVGSHSLGLEAETLDRDVEVRSILAFLDDSSEAVLEVIGLPQIGKSSAIRKALAQSGMQPDRILTIELSATATPDYLVSSLIRRGGGHRDPPFADATAALNDPAALQALSEHQVLLLSGGHNLLRGNEWRDEVWPTLLEAVIAKVGTSGAKLILETRREMPWQLPDPAARRPLRVKGLDSSPGTDFGTRLFDAQLRRVGLRPEEFDRSRKAEIVAKLRGHPVAIALAADASFNEGIDAVREALRKRKGFFLNFLERIVKWLDLDESQALVLKLLSLSRGPIPRDVVLVAAGIPVAIELKELIALGAVEVMNNGDVQIADVIRDYFDSESVSDEQRRRFHVRASEVFAQRFRAVPALVEAAVEAELHAALGGIYSGARTNLADGLLGTARQLFDRGRFAEAQRHVSALLQLKPTVELRRMAALTAAHLGDFGAAIKSARDVFVQNPRDTALLAELAKISLTLSKSDEVADEMIEMARRAGVEDASLLIVEGRKWLRLGALDRAEEVFDRAIGVARRNAWPYYYLGRVQIRSGRVEEAIDTLNRGEEYCYDNDIGGRSVLSALRTELAEAYILTGRYDAAEPLIETLLEDQPDRPEVARVNAALSLKRHGPKEAEAAYQNLLKRVGKNRLEKCKTHLGYGMFLLAINEPQRAADQFREAHAADRSDVFVMMKLARVLLDIGNARYLDGDETYKAYVADCARLVRQILRFDNDNAEGLSLVEILHTRFGITA